MSLGVQKRTLGLVRDWTPAVVGTALPGLVALRRGRDMKGNLRTANIKLTDKVGDKIDKKSKKSSNGIHNKYPTGWGLLNAFIDKVNKKSIIGF